MSKKAGVDNTFRRTWDKEEFREKAEEREKEVGGRCRVVGRSRGLSGGSRGLARTLQRPCARINCLNWCPARRRRRMRRRRWRPGSGGGWVSTAALNGAPRLCALCGGAPGTRPVPTALAPAPATLLPATLLPAPTPQHNSPSHTPLRCRARPAAPGPDCAARQPAVARLPDRPARQAQQDASGVAGHAAQPAGARLGGRAEAEAPGLSLWRGCSGGAATLHGTARQPSLLLLVAVAAVGCQWQPRPREPQPLAHPAPPWTPTVQPHCLQPCDTSPPPPPARPPRRRLGTTALCATASCATPSPTWTTSTASGTTARWA